MIKIVHTESLVESGPFSDILSGYFDGNSGVGREFLEFICGERLGHGMSREVYVYRIDPRYVIKIELLEHRFQNITEIEAWQTVEFTKFAKWFAPIKAISGCGRFMLQRRTKPASIHALPEKMPSFFTDFKPENFGMLGKELVAHDYGRNLLSTNGLTARMKKVTWL